MDLLVRADALELLLSKRAGSGPSGDIGVYPPTISFWSSRLVLEAIDAFQIRTVQPPLVKRRGDSSSLARTDSQFLTISLIADHPRTDSHQVLGHPYEQAQEK